MQSFFFFHCYHEKSTWNFCLFWTVFTSMRSKSSLRTLWKCEEVSAILLKTSNTHYLQVTKTDSEYSIPIREIMLFVILISSFMKFNWTFRRTRNATNAVLWYQCYHMPALSLCWPTTIYLKKKTLKKQYGRHLFVNAPVQNRQAKSEKNPCFSTLDLNCLVCNIFFCGSAGGLARRRIFEFFTLPSHFFSVINYVKWLSGEI